MLARTPRTHTRRSVDADSEDDEIVWQMLRARAELTVQAQPLMSAPPALPLRTLPLAQANHLSRPTMTFDQHEDYALHLLDDDAVQSLSTRGRALPVSLLASLALVIFTVALTHHFVAEAEQQARIEQVVSDIQRVGAQAKAPMQGEVAHVPPLAEVPASETLRAFQKLSVSTVSTAPTSSTRVRLNLVAPPQVIKERKVQPAARAVTKATAVPRPTARTKGPERKVEPDLSDDPLRDL